MYDVLSFLLLLCERFSANVDMHFSCSTMLHTAQCYGILALLRVVRSLDIVDSYSNSHEHNTHIHPTQLLTPENSLVTIYCDTVNMIRSDTSMIDLNPADLKVDWTRTTNGTTTVLGSTPYERNLIVWPVNKNLSKAEKDNMRVEISAIPDMGFLVLPFVQRGVRVLI